MNSAVTPYKNNLSKKEQVAAMFNNIAPKYDLLNTILSFGIHKSWRKKAIGFLQNKNPKTILDVATGTGDFAIEALSLNPDLITGIDISDEMLRLGIKKIIKCKADKKIKLVHGDSENLPFEAFSFDAVIVAFGVRNFENLEQGLENIFRVLKPEGTLVVLEFSKPKTLFIRKIYTFYFNNMMPFIGKIISKDSSAYSYLPESVNAFPDGADFIKIMEKVGFSDTNFCGLTFNIANIYTGKK